MISNHFADPGPWQEFLKRYDNRGLSIMQAKQKYLKEAYNHQTYMQMQMLTQQQLNQIQAQVVAGSGSEQSYFDLDYVEDYVQ